MKNNQKYNYEKILATLNALIEHSNASEETKTDLKQAKGIVETRYKETIKLRENMARWRQVNGRHGDETYQARRKMKYQNI